MSSCLCGLSVACCCERSFCGSPVFSTSLFLGLFWLILISSCAPSLSYCGNSVSIPSIVLSPLSLHLPMLSVCCSMCSCLCALLWCRNSLFYRVVVSLCTASFIMVMVSWSILFCCCCCWCAVPLCASLCIRCDCSSTVGEESLSSMQVPSSWCGTSMLGSGWSTGFSALLLSMTFCVLHRCGLCRCAGCYDSCERYVLVARHRPSVPTLGARRTEITGFHIHSMWPAVLHMTVVPCAHPPLVWGNVLSQCYRE